MLATDVSFVRNTLRPSLSLPWAESGEMAGLLTQVKFLTAPA